ncbi:MAG: hypothetical protein J2P17_05720 [Mycobacterium sp.]|nr:hypothetical protein [Mycobacterium sp.]
MIQVVRECAAQLEADLAREYPGTDIRDWIRWVFRGEGTLTSRRMHNLILGLTDRSETKKALRDGDWCEEQYIHARIANELMYSRADFAAAYGGRMDPHPFKSPKQLAEDAEETAAAHKVRDLLRAQVHGEFVPPAQPGRTFEGETGNGAKHSIKNTVGGEL